MTRLMPLVAVTILWSLLASAGLLASHWEPFDETRQALDRLHLDTAKLEITGEDLAKSSSFSGPTHRWLKGSKIAVSDHSRFSGYLARIHLASGME